MEEIVFLVSHKFHFIKVHDNLMQDPSNNKSIILDSARMTEPSMKTRRCGSTMTTKIWTNLPAWNLQTGMVVCVATR